MTKYTNNSLTPVTLMDRLNWFKHKVDDSVQTFLDADLEQVAKDAINYKKVGGLHHWRVGRLGGSVFMKKAPRITKPVKYKPESVAEPLAEPTMSDMELLKLEWRMNQIQKRKTSDVGAYNWVESE